MRITNRHQQFFADLKGKFDIWKCNSQLDDRNLCKMLNAQNKDQYKYEYIRIKYACGFVSSSSYNFLKLANHDERAAINQIYAQLPSSIYNCRANREEAREKRIDDFNFRYYYDKEGWYIILNSEEIKNLQEHAYDATEYGDFINYLASLKIGSKIPYKHSFFASLAENLYENGFFKHYGELYRPLKTLDVQARVIHCIQKALSNKNLENVDIDHILQIPEVERRFNSLVECIQNNGGLKNFKSWEELSIREKFKDLLKIIANVFLAPERQYLRNSDSEVKYFVNIVEREHRQSCAISVTK